MWQFSRVQPDEPDVAELLNQHFRLMREQSPPESCHVLPAEDLVSPEISVFALRDGGTAIAIGAVRQTGEQGELKSMHTAARVRGQGAARQLLQAIVEISRAAGIRRLILETGSGSEHLAARSLYASEGFSTCPPFGDYTEDPLSLFMTRAI